MVPTDWAHDPDGYVDHVRGPMLDACAPLAKWADVFCERGAFDEDQSRAILVAARDRGLGLRIHANQLGPGPGARLAAELGAASADHVTYLTEDDIWALSDAGVVATLLPVADLSTREPWPDARGLIEAGTTVALATDCNPGTSFTTNMPIVVALAVTAMRMTPAEALWSATAGGARALQRDDVGTLKAGSRADLVLLDAPSHVHLSYRPGVPLVDTVIHDGVVAVRGPLNRPADASIPEACPFGGLACVCVTACVAAAVLVCSASVTHATTADRIDRARAQLRGLSDQVAAQSAAVEDARARADAAGERAAQAGAALVPLTVHRIQLAQQVAETQSELTAAQDELNAAAVEVFISSPGTVPGNDTLAALLGAESIEQLQDRLAYGEAVASDRQATIEQVAALYDRLAGEVATEDALVAAAEDVRARQEASLEEQQAALTQEQEALAGLAAARDSVVALLDRLRARLAPADIAAVAQAFQGQDNVSYGEWAHAFLRVMGAPVCHENLVVTIAWQAQEGTQAAWNPLATTHRMDGSTDFNSVGVQNFQSLEQGLQASKETIENGWDVYRYGAIIRSMRDCADPLDTARAIADSSWCFGCAGGQYVIGIVPAVEASFETYADL